MIKKTLIAGASALALASMASSVLAADYKGPDLKGEVVTITCLGRVLKKASSKK